MKLVPKVLRANLRLLKAIDAGGVSLYYEDIRPVIVETRNIINA